ncbi:HlyD family secretion protein [Salipiger abyssi]|uniref:HlyD family secretion protein n=1 Tax=Salipiger abyssi TaxID=1250539 RepID=UPI001A8FFC99|nr:HlyD family efflux transporter periplasmic adaptor subunit [Salipiger abyssi]MBN9890215.1 HlyD family efflux transporter periplasmic adaptor subunit [Salipiger abyssi]
MKIAGWQFPGAVTILAILAGAMAAGWWFLQPAALPEGLAKANGRLEAVEIDIATRSGGRLQSVLVAEGDFVIAGQELAVMDTATLQAQLREARANLSRAVIGVEIARSGVAQSEAQARSAQALVELREVEQQAAAIRLARSEGLAVTGATPQSRLDDDRAAHQAARAAVAAAEAQLAAAQAGIDRARSDVIGAESGVEAAEAAIVRIEAELADAVLKAPRDGRVQYRVAELGEVLPPGGTVVNMVDLADVHMNFFLPTAQAGQLALGDEVRLILDAAPEFVIPARVSFVASVAQFTPRTVETEAEREKLMFRIRARIDPDLLRQHEALVKTGLPGTAYVRIDPAAEWPADLAPRLPQ